ncbi:hypothetical protein A3D73_01335 [Candidatus Uhrbacteria bacterium RIFCSPHIGHO2_02_FULL_60_44]|nr:MAG: hypothetical protein A3D73_01335 [Candidatus Uhrbacteria bacterium RIFCSPHIGHO2_02_FULL_60_44]
MANQIAYTKQDGLLLLPACDVCGRVLPKGTATRHPACEVTSENEGLQTAEVTFETIRLMERARFERTTQDLSPFRRAVTMQRYDHARSAYVVLDLLVTMSEIYSASHAMAGDIARLKYQFLRFALDHPKFQQG